MRFWSRWAVLTGLVILAVGLDTALWPIHGTGVRGNAIRPHYRASGWFTYQPVTQTSLESLRRAGVTIP